VREKAEMKAAACQSTFAAFVDLERQLWLVMGCLQRENLQSLLNYFPGDLPHQNQLVLQRETWNGAATPSPHYSVFACLLSAHILKPQEFLKDAEKNEG